MKKPDAADVISEAIAGVSFLIFWTAWVVICMFAVTRPEVYRSELTIPSGIGALLYLMAISAVWGYQLAAVVSLLRRYLSSTKPNRYSTSTTSGPQ